MRILNWLNRPYPRISHFRGTLTVSLLFGLFVYLFLLFFEPFGIADVVKYKALIVLGFGIITFLGVFLSGTIIPFLAPRWFDPEMWTTWKGIIFSLWNILVIALLNYQYLFFLDSNFSQEYILLYILMTTIAVGIFPITIKVFISELYLSDKHQKQAVRISTQIQNERDTPSKESLDTIRIIGDSIQDSLELKENELIYIKAEDNYCQVHYTRDQQLNNKLLRISLKNIETQLENSVNILRCHRSYIVNKRRVVRITGNARAYYLHFETCDNQVPVSRSFEKGSLAF